MSDVPTETRRLLTLLVVVASAGYVARIAISVVAPQIMSDFGLTQTQMGTIFSAFLLGYTAMQIPSGWLADRVQTKMLFCALTVAWLALTVATAAVRSLPTISLATLFIVLRVLLGITACRWRITKITPQSAFGISLDNASAIDKN